jgi:hypothetical protein
MQIRLFFLWLGLLYAPALFAQDGAYLLVFSARNASWKPFSIGGHAFVTWARIGKNQQMHLVETYGFYPNQKKNMFQAITSLESGQVIEGYLLNSKGKRTYQLKVQVDSTTWTQSLCNAEGWNGRAYNLIYNNCNDFLSAVAEQAGLKTPKTNNLFGFPRNPVKYIKKLWRKNKNRVGRLYTNS